MMRRNIKRIALATLLFAGAALAQGPQSPTCTMTGRAGEYGFTWSGTMFLPTGPVLVTAVGRSTFDDAGNFSATQTLNRGGTVIHLTVKGTYTQNPDCTGTVTANTYDSSGNLVSKVTWANVSVNNMTEAHGVMTSFATADGTNVPVAITSFNKKLFNGHVMLVLPYGSDQAAK